MIPRAVGVGEFVVDGEPIGCARLDDGRRVLLAAPVRTWLEGDLGDLQEVRFVDKAGVERAGYEARHVVAALNAVYARVIANTGNPTDAEYARAKRCFALVAAFALARPTGQGASS